LLFLRFADERYLKAFALPNRWPAIKITAKKVQTLIPCHAFDMPDVCRRVFLRHEMKTESLKGILVYLFQALNKRVHT
jgi:hypothetical protein